MNWSRRLTLLGIGIAMLGFVALIWTQAHSPLGGGLGFDMPYRWQIAMGPLDVIGIGTLVSIGAQIMGVLQAAAPGQSSS